VKKILLAACAVLAMTGSALGGENKEYAKVGGWGIYNSDEHCAAGADYQNGTSLIFGVNTEGQTWLKVFNEAWKIPAGSYTVGAWIDKVELNDLTFTASEDGHSIINQFNMGESSYNLITRGNRLSLVIGGTTYQYILKDTSVVLPKLLECIGTVARSANPFAGQSPAEQPAAPVSTPSNPFRRT
jgi:hypothetical protein